jgi:predicted permease
VLVVERIVSVIGPVFLIIAIGYGYGRRNRPDLKSFNHVSLHVLGPLLVFTSLAGEDFQLAGNAAFVAGGVAVILVSGLIAWPVAILARVSPRTFVPPMMFNNCGNMGLRSRCWRSGARASRRWCCCSWRAPCCSSPSGAASSAATPNGRRSRLRR